MSDFDLAHKAFDRMKRARDRGTGCYLTADMIHELGITFLGQVWDEERVEAETFDTAPSRASRALEEKP